MGDPISYDVDGAAEATGTSPDRIRRAIRSGELTAHYHSRGRGHPVIARADLEAWVLALPTERVAS